MVVLILRGPLRLNLIGGKIHKTHPKAINNQATKMMMMMMTTMTITTIMTMAMVEKERWKAAKEAEDKRKGEELRKVEERRRMAVEEAVDAINCGLVAAPCFAAAAYLCISKTCPTTWRRLSKAQ